MNATKIVQRRMLLSMSLVFATTLAAAQSAQMPAVGEFSVGDRWEWRQFDNRTKLEEPAFSRAVIEEKGVREFAYSDGRRRPLDDPYVGEPSAKPWRVWPLEVGKAWSSDMNFTRFDGVTGNLKQDARVLAYEEVVVPGGKFMAFKIEKDGYITLNNGFRGRIVDNFWYAPSARADVKHIRKVGNTDFTRELVKYPPHKQ